MRSVSSGGMALTSGEFHTITILPSSGAAWTLYTPPYPSLPSTIVDAQVNGTSFVVYCIDAATGWLAFQGGQVVGLLDAVLNTVSAALTKTSFTDTASNVSVWGEDGSGDVWVYTSSSGILQRYDAAEVTALKAFLP